MKTTTTVGGRRRAEQAAQQLADVLEEIGRNEAAIEPNEVQAAPLADLAQLGGLLGELTADDDSGAVQVAVREDFFGEAAETGEMVARTIGTRGISKLVGAWPRRVKT